MVPRSFVFFCCAAIFCGGSITLAANKASRVRKPRVSDSSSSSRAKNLAGRGSKVESSADDLAKSKRPSKETQHKSKAKDGINNLQALVQRMEAALIRLEQEADSRVSRLRGATVSSTNRYGSGTSVLSSSSSKASNSGVWMVVRRNATVVPLSSLSTLNSPVASALTVQNVVPALGNASILSSGNVMSTFGNGPTSFSGTQIFTRSPHPTLHYRGVASPFVTPSAGYPYATFTGASQATVSSGGAVAPTSLIIGGSTIYSVPSVPGNYIQ
jgi:hypothetical protein